MWNATLGPPFPELSKWELQLRYPHGTGTAFAADDHLTSALGITI